MVAQSSVNRQASIIAYSHMNRHLQYLHRWVEGAIKAAGLKYVHFVNFDGSRTMNRKFVLMVSVAALVISTSACGGGSGGGVNSVSGSPPAPLPPAPPCTGTQCLQAVDIFPATDQSTTFASLGLEATGRGSPVEELTRDGFSVSYNAEAGVYIFDVPSSGPGGFYENTGNTPSSRFWNGEIAEASTNVSVYASVLKPTPTNPVIQLTYTTYALYGSTYQGGPFGFVAFGSPTPQGAIPVTGTATYNAAVEGATLDTGEFVKGSATLQFNFGPGTLSGHFDPVIYDYLAYGDAGLSLGRYDFTNTIYSFGSTNFSGDLVRAGLNGHGSFEGRFTGPVAQELMSRWTAPYIKPGSNTPSEMFGVWVGRKP
jgi:hypothetical protein